MNAPIEPTITTDDIVAGIDALVTRGEDLVYTDDAMKEIRLSMPAVPLLHLAMMPSDYKVIVRHMEVPADAWNEETMRNTIPELARTVVLCMLAAGATTYRVSHINLSRRDRWIDVNLRVVAPVPIRPTVTVDEFAAALGVQITAAVARGGDIVSSTPDGECRVPMPTTAPTHVVAAISPGCSTGKRAEVPSHEWNEKTRHDSIDMLADAFACVILKAGATIYHVKSVTLSNRGADGWTDFSVRVVMPACASECNHLREQKMIGV